MVGSKDHPSPALCFFNLSKQSFETKLLPQLHYVLCNYKCRRHKQPPQVTFVWLIVDGGGGYATNGNVKDILLLLRLYLRRIYIYVK